MAKADPNFRPDHRRSIQVFGEFNDDLVGRLAPEILRLRAESGEPITVLINSNGGATRCLDYLHGLLTANAGINTPPRLITVVIGNARSAAANLLTLGDYAVAYPRTAIHFHGVRFGEVADVTMESASSMAAQLLNANRNTAAALARVGTQRLAFHYARLRDKFPKICEMEGKSVHEVQCFARCLKENLSPNGDLIVDKALERWSALSELSERVLENALRSGKKGIEFEADVLRGVIDFEVEKNKEADWSLNQNGVYQVLGDYLLLRDYGTGSHNKLAATIFSRFRHAFFAAAELKQLQENPDAQTLTQEAQAFAQERFKRVIMPFCFFAVSIWQGLQEDENPLSPRDAYWLGAVDEVIGTNLPCLRDIAEADATQEPTLPGIKT